jgi:hypothetical protein
MKRSKAKGRHPFGKTVSKHTPSPFYIPSLDRGWQHVLGEARTRILLRYLLILGSVFLVGIPAFRYLLFQRVDERVHRNMAEEVETFRELISQNQRTLQNPEDYDPEDLEQLQESFLINNSDIIPPASKEELAEFFRRYLRYRIPVDDTFLITFIDGKFFKSSPRARPLVLNADSSLMRQWGIESGSGLDLWK